MIGPKEKKERRLGEKLQLKKDRCQSPKCAALRRPYPPGVHGPKAKFSGSFSEFGLQLREKQKFKLTYGLDERNLRRLFEKAQKETGSIVAKLIQLLESRLDNVVFRLGFAGSRGVARQIVSHGHIMVNGERVRSPGYEVKKGDIITIRPQSLNKLIFSSLAENLKKYEPPSWLHLDKEKLEGRVLSLPKDVEIPFEINLLVESFSK